MPRRHPPEKESAVLADVPTLGVTATARKHEVSPGYVSKLARENGVETVHSERTAAATEAHAARAEELRGQVANRMWEIADKASRRELELIAAGSKLRDVVGARTRAIHDAELLSGRATQRTETIDTVDAELQRLAAEVKARADARS